jgi:glutathione S-transferase
MGNRRMLVHAGFMLLLPVIVAWFGLSTASAIGLVVLSLFWRWMLSLAAIIAPEKAPGMILDTIPSSHFVEKVRWNMDRAGIDYVENPSGGTLSAFYAGRTVPRLRFRTGVVRSQIGNSAEILRYLWGACSPNPDFDVAFLEPTAERLAFENRCDRYGANLQVWVYRHILPHPGLTLKLWGADDPNVPRWQRLALRLLYPVQRRLITRSFRITDEGFEKATHHIEKLLAELDATLADGRTSILGGDDLNYTDFAFAAMTGLWMQPPQYSGGKASFIASDRRPWPEPMRRDVERWEAAYPAVVRWVEALYQEERS